MNTTDNRAPRFYRQRLDDYRRALASARGFEAGEILRGLGCTSEAGLEKLADDEARRFATPGLTHVEAQIVHLQSELEQLEAQRRSEQERTARLESAEGELRQLRESFELMPTAEALRREAAQLESELVTLTVASRNFRTGDPTFTRQRDALVFRLSQLEVHLRLAPRIVGAIQSEVAAQEHAVAELRGEPKRTAKAKPMVTA